MFQLKYGIYIICSYQLAAKLNLLVDTKTDYSYILIYIANYLSIFETIQLAM